MEMKKYKLGELMEVTRGMSLCGEYYATEGDLMRLTLGNFDYRNNCFKDDKSKDNLFFSGDVKDEFILNKGDIITPLTEQAIGLLGSTAKVPCSGKYIQSQDVGLIKCNEKLHPDFAFYLIPSKLVRNQLSAAAQQTKIRHTSPDKIKSCTVWIPEYSKQEEIGKLLSTLDDKIALNRRMNAKLEQMAKRLYDHWFVQFDFPVSCHFELVSESRSEEMLNQVQHDERIKPYKSSGGKMVWNETLKREIPDGWEVKCVSDVIEPIERGISYSSEEIKNECGIPMLNLACFDKQGEYRSGEFKFFTGKVTDKVYPFEMFIACTDMTQNADIIGRPIFAPTEYKEYLYSMDLAKITPKSISKMYLYYTLRTEFYHKYIKPFASGTNVKHLNIDGTERYTIPVPLKDMLEKFEITIRPIKEKQQICLQEIQKLTALRDQLLPLLMNGQVQI